MKSVYIVTDLEGVAGVVSFDDQAYDTGRYYDRAKRLAMAEVNAAVEGFMEEGVEDILIWDGHGAGGLWFEDMHPAAKMMHGRPSAPRSVRDPIVCQYDALAIIGQHAMAGVAESNMNHTQSSRHIDSYHLNGQPIGEIAQLALYWGSYGMPLIFLTGEEAACREAEELVPRIVTASTKRGLSRNSAISVSALEARRRIREGAKQAVKQHRENPLAPLAWEGPYVLEKRFFHTDEADQAAEQPGAERVDGQTVRFRAEEIRDVIYR